MLISVVPGEISFKDTVIVANQRDKKLVVKVIRKLGLNGRIISPWSVTAADDDSPYKVSKKS